METSRKFAWDAKAKMHVKIIKFKILRVTGTIGSVDLGRGSNLDHLFADSVAILIKIVLLTLFNLITDKVPSGQLKVGRKIC